MQSADNQSNYFQTVEAHSRRIYLRARIRHLLSKADHEPNPKRRFDLLYEVLLYVRHLRNNKGISAWPILAFACSLGVAAVLWLANQTRHTYFFRYPQDYLRVVQNLDLERGDFVMQRVTNGVPGPEVEMHFRGQVPRFESGHTLAWIRYMDTGSEQILDGWDLVREDKLTFAGGQWRRMPTIAPNCVPDWTVNHVICEGGKARF